MGNVNAVCTVGALVLQSIVLYKSSKEHNDIMKQGQKEHNDIMREGQQVANMSDLKERHHSTNKELNSLLFGDRHRKYSDGMALIRGTLTEGLDGPEGNITDGEWLESKEDELRSAAKDWYDAYKKHLKNAQSGEEPELRINRSRSIARDYWEHVACTNNQRGSMLNEQK